MNTASGIPIEPSINGVYRLTAEDKLRYAEYMNRFKDASWDEQFSAMNRAYVMILNGWTEEEYYEVMEMTHD